MKQISGCTQERWERRHPINNSQGITRFWAVTLFILFFGIHGLLAQNPCDNNCEIQCEDQINVSLDASCQATITAAMGGIGIDSTCNNYFDIKVYDEFGNEVPNDLVDLSHRNTDMTFRITEPVCGNSCTGNLLVEYKLPPQIICPPDDTLSCGALNLLGVPPAVGACAGFEVFLFNETRQALTCDTLFTSIITRTYKAVDDFGNEDTCSHTIYLERLRINDVETPLPVSISCTDPLYEFLPNGAPVPFPSDPATGSGSGVPVICDPSVTNGYFCPSTGSGTGIPLIPGAITGSGTTIPTQVGCSAAITFTDLEIPGPPCVTRFIRTWEVREWWCNAEITTGGTQLIEIVDDVPPEFECPDDFTVTTNDDCAGSVQLPPISATDACENGVIVNVDFPLGFLTTNGGPAMLEVGENIITYIVSDSCAIPNSATCNMTVTVQDNTEPVAICDQDVDVNLSNNGLAEVFVETFDEGSWDDCELDRVEVRRMDTTCMAMDTLFGESIVFCCEDVGNEDLMIVLRAVDVGGNENQCMIRVHVDDKILPSMTCPPDATIDCRDAFDLNNLGVSFGNPVVSDNCAETQIVIETVTTDINSCNIGEITRVFELRDPNGIAYQTCMQHIDVLNSTPFEASNIEWPLDYAVVGGCGIEGLLPQALPDLYNYPTFSGGDDECSLLAYDFEDEVFDGSGGGEECLYIERTWTVINWCSQVNGIFETFTIPEPQIIELINTENPVIVDQDDLVFESGNVDCENTDVFIQRTATDDCPNPLSWGYILRNEDMVIIETGDTNVIEGVYEVGTYFIEWSVSDGCGNFDFDTQSFEVVNTKSPSPICLGGMNLYLLPMDTDMNGTADAEMVMITTDIIDGGSYHTCNNPFTLSFSQDTSVHELVFDCDDLGVQTIQLYATDNMSGAQDFCEVFVNVVDTNDVEICVENLNMVDVQGKIQTEMFDEIEGVNVNLGVPDLDDTTNEQGDYAFENMPMGGNYRVEPFKDDEHLNGLSTLDLIFIQRHILGIQNLSSPYKVIAADVNNSLDITAQDLIELRKIILGIYNELPENTSWRFVDAGHNFNDPMDPWLAGFPEDYEINNLSTDMQIDFIGLKVGDVNNSAITQNMDSGGQIENRSSERIHFQASAGAVKAGERSQIDIYGSNYKNIAGWQMSWKFDPARVEILNIKPAALDIEPAYHCYIQNEKGILNISYNEPLNRNVSNKEVLFSIELISQTEAAATELLQVNTGHYALESYTESGTIKAIDFGPVQDNSLEIIAASPNPWINSTEIRYTSASAQDAEWQFYNIDGKLLFNEKVELKQGPGTYEVQRQTLNSSGVVYVRLITENAVSDYKMILID